MTLRAISLPGVSDADNATLASLLKQLEAKQPRNLLRASYYDGKRAIHQVGTVIPPMYYRLGLVLGWSAKAVDVLSRRANVCGVSWAGGDLGSLGYDEIERGNNLLAELSAGATSAMIHATAFLVSTTGEGDEPAGLLHVRDAMSATGLWNPRTRRLDNLLSVTERDQSGEITGLVLYLDGQTIEARRDGKWSVEKSDHSYGVPAEVMAYHPRPGRPFGSSRISNPVMSLHDAALRTVIRMEGHADVYSFPEMWMLGADGSIFKNEDGTQKAAWQVMLGRIKGIPDDDEATNPRADVKQFSASSPEPHIAQLKQQAMMFSGETSIPLTSLGVSDMSNPTSADSYIASREDLIAEAEGFADDNTVAIGRAVARTLAMSNGETGVPDTFGSIVPRWRSPMHLSRAAAADAGQKQLAAVPWLAETEVGLELLGLTDDQIKRALADQRRAQGRGVLASLRKVADAGTVVTPGDGGPSPVGGQ